MYLQKIMKIMSCSRFLELFSFQFSVFLPCNRNKVGLEEAAAA